VAAETEISRPTAVFRINASAEAIVSVNGFSTRASIPASKSALDDVEM
jgi:hypothetical protein